MAEIVNLRMARKRARRKADEARTADRRLTHGTPKAARALAEAERSRAAERLDAHRLDQDDPAFPAKPSLPET